MKRILNKKSIFLVFLFLIIFLSIPTSLPKANELDSDKFNDLAGLTVETDDNGMVSIKQYKDNKDNMQTQAWNTVFSKYEMIILGISAVLSLTFVLLFMINIAKFTSSAGNPQERQKYMKAILWTGIGSAGFGAVTMIMGMAFKTFQK